MRRAGASPGPRAPAAGLALALAVALGAIGPACGAPEPTLPARDAAAPAVRGAIVAEPPRIAVGQTTRLEIAVVTPPGYRVRPPAPPESLPGFWILDTRLPPVERHPERWIHRLRLRLRAREVGSFAWPATTLAVEDPKGREQTLELPARPLEVVSVLPEFAGRDEPFGLRGPPREAPRGPLLPAAAGALATLAGLGAALVARRTWRRRRARAAAQPPPGAPPWETAAAALGEAARRADAQPVAAADAAAVVLRRYVTGRFGADALARTTEELAAARPPYAARRAWPGLLELLGGLDAARFRPGTAAAEVREQLARARAFVAETTPPGAQR